MEQPFGEFHRGQLGNAPRSDFVFLGLSLGGDVDASGLTVQFLDHGLHLLAKDLGRNLSDYPSSLVRILNWASAFVPQKKPIWPPVHDGEPNCYISFLDAHFSQSVLDGFFGLMTQGVIRVDRNRYLNEWHMGLLSSKVTLPLAPAFQLRTAELQK